MKANDFSKLDAQEAEDHLAQITLDEGGITMDAEPIPPKQEDITPAIGL